MLKVLPRPEGPPVPDVHCPQPKDQQGVKLAQQLDDAGAGEVALGRELCKKKK